jgi:PAS domain S-box-containing protein
MPPSLSPDRLSQIGAREILDSLADGAYITDLERRIVFWNRAATRITGWRGEDVLGHTCSDNILVHVDKDGHALCGKEHCPLHRSMVTGECSGEPLLVFAQHKEGHRLPVEVAVAPIRDAAGTILGGIEVFRDLTDLFEDLRRARRIQDQALESLLPSDERLQIEVRYSPEEIVGGDFYRMERLGADRYAVLIADVMGHGVASALYTMQLRSLWEECRADLGDPARFLAEVNRRLRRLVQPEGYFATAFFAVLDLQDDAIDYVRAGHPAPFLYPAAGAVQRLDCRAPALALFDEPVYQTTTVAWRPGDSLLLFTDGAIEIAGATDDELGDVGLQRLVEDERTRGPLQLEAVERRLLLYSNQVHLEDDLTLLHIARKPSGLPGTPNPL